jgi:MFS family permease
MGVPITERMDSSLRGQRVRLREMLEDPNLRLLLGAQFIAQAADGFAQATFANVLVLEPLAAGTPLRILSLFALTLLPYSLISPFMGVFVDRWSRRGLMVWANVIRGALLTTLPLWERALPGDLGFYAALLFLLSLGRLFLTTKSAVLPVLLHEHHLLRGNALSSGGGMVSALIGGSVGLFASGAFGQTGAFVTAGFIYLGGAAVIGRLAQSYAHPHAHVRNMARAAAELAGALVEGLSAIWARIKARLALIGIFLLRTIGMFVFIAAILVIKDVYPREADDFGRLSSSALALGAAGLGAFVGAISAPMAGRRLEKAGLIIFGFFVSGAGIVALGGVENVPALLALTFFGGYGGFVTKVAVDAQVQEALPDELRGRAFALYDILFNLASVVAAGLMVVFEPISLRPKLVFTGVLALACAAALAVVMARRQMPLLRAASAPGA